MPKYGTQCTNSKTWTQCTTHLVPKYANKICRKWIEIVWPKGFIRIHRKHNIFDFLNKHKILQKVTNLLINHRNRMEMKTRGMALIIRLEELFKESEDFSLNNVII